jgi:hypothetical protein
VTVTDPFSNLAVEAEYAREGGGPPSVVLLLRPDRLPRAVVTDERGLSHHRVISPADLLSILDRSTTLDAIREKPEARKTSLPPLPSGTVLVDLVEDGTADGRQIVLTGVVPGGKHLFPLKSGGERSTHLVPLPPICYRTVHDCSTNTSRSFSLALLAPAEDRRGGADPGPDTTLFRWPFSNVYGSFGGTIEGVCWYARGRVVHALSEAPKALVRTFLAIENDADRYAGDLAHNAPYGGYRTFLEALEEQDAFPAEWLVPADLTIAQLHAQRREPNQTKGSEAA